MDLKPEEGSFLVEYARKEIEAHFGAAKPQTPDAMRSLMSRKLPVFIKIDIHPTRTLRGSAGYTEKIMPLGSALVDVALSAAFRDPRFHPLRKSELKSVTVEVSILSETTHVNADDPSKYPEHIAIGRDGIIVEKDSKKGVMLPQTAADMKLNPKTAMSFAAMAGGLPADAWHDPKAKVFKFQAQVFSEDEPCGRITERKLTKG